MKLGVCPGEAGSGSCTNSTTLASPMSLVADTLVAGNAFGTTFRIVRRRELVTDKDEMVNLF